MSEYMFGVRVRDGRTPGRERDRREAIANRHGCTWVEIYEPTGQWKSWFAGPNRGHPFDQQMGESVMAEVHEEVSDGQEV
jgi:hypothetical protein